MPGSISSHWDTIYSSTALDQLGWFEAQPEPSLQLIERCELALDAPILDAGSGTTTLLAALIDKGYRAYWRLISVPQRSQGSFR
jgi:hypothetical protein